MQYTFTLEYDELRKFFRIEIFNLTGDCVGSGIAHNYQELVQIENGLKHLQIPGLTLMINFVGQLQ